MTVFRHRIKVRGSELDSFGHVNNAVYLSYLEDARWDFLEKTGLLGQFSEKSQMLAVVEVRIRFIRECRLHDRLEVLTRLLPGPLFVDFSQEIFDVASKARVCSAEVRTLLLDSRRKPVDFPSGIRRKHAARSRRGIRE